MIRRSLACLTPAVALVAAVAAYAGDSVDQEKTVAREGVVHIHNLRGKIRIIGEDTDRVHVEGELDDLATGFTFEVKDDETTIRVEMPKQDVNFGDGSDLDITVPTGSRIEFSGVSTDVTVRDVKGGTLVRSVSGDIDADGIDKEVMIKSVSGDVTLRDSRGRVRVTSVSGDLDLALDAKDVMVDTVSGEIDLELRDFDRLQSTTVSGDLDVQGHLNDNGELSMKSVSGDIELLFVGKVNAAISVKTGPGGDIINGVTADEPKEIFPARAALDTTSGDGSGDVRISSVSGDVRLRKQE